MKKRGRTAKERDREQRPDTIISLERKIRMRFLAVRNLVMRKVMKPNTGYDQYQSFNGLFTQVFCRMFSKYSITQCLSV